MTESNLPGGVELLIFAAVLGLIPGFIARYKGRSFVTWWIFGALFFIIALPLILFMPRNRRGQRQCPSCMEWIHEQASACPRCGRDIPTLTGQLA